MYSVSLQNPFPIYKEINNDKYEQLKQEVYNLFYESLQEFLQKINPQDAIALCSDNKRTSEYPPLFDGIYKNQYQQKLIIGAGGKILVYYKLYLYSQKLQANQDFFNLQFSNLQKCFQNQKSTFNDFFLPIKYLTMMEQSFEALIKAYNKSQDSQKKYRISYFFGEAGIYLYGCYLYKELKNLDKFKQCLQMIMQTKKYIFQNQSIICYEILYGVAGFLYILLDLQQNFQSNKQIDPTFQIDIQQDVIDITLLLLENGISSFEKQFKYKISRKNPAFPLNYFRIYVTFHNKEYLGGAHGLFGVLYVLLTSFKLNKNHLLQKYPHFDKYIIESLNFGLGMQGQNGNFPTSPRTNSSLEYFQFCHGSPGIVPTLALASQVFPEQQQYYSSALLGAQSIWNYGIIKKGFGLCHGISGNAYSFLTLYDLTKSEEWKYNAIVFALIKKEESLMKVIRSYDFEDRYVIGMSDYPYSLMQGLSGDLCLLFDIIEQEKSYFPGYTLK